MADLKSTDTTPHSGEIPPVHYAERMARVDGCPWCVLNTETPRTVHDTAHGFKAFYRCHDCGYAWSTCWEDC